jgi:hypothetical protein
VWVKVEYSGRVTPLTSRQVFDFFKDKKETSLKEYFSTTLGIKANAWKSENEWRFLWRNDETRLKIHRVPISESAISAVYIGQNASKSDEEDMVFEVKNKFPTATIIQGKKAARGLRHRFRSDNLGRSHFGPAHVSCKSRLACCATGGVENMKSALIVPNRTAMNTILISRMRSLSNQWQKTTSRSYNFVAIQAIATRPCW